MENGKQNHLGSDRILLGRNNDDSLLVSRVSSQFIASESTFEWASLIDPFICKHLFYDRTYHLKSTSEHICVDGFP